MAYEELKATKKSSKSETAKNAIASALGSISKPKSTGTRKPRSTASAKSTGTKSTKSSTKSGANKTTSSTSTRSTKKTTSSTGTRRTSTKKTTSSEPVISFAAPVIAAVAASSKSKNTSKRNSDSQSQKKNTKSGLALLLIVLFLGIGIVGGFFATKYVCRNDVYEMVAYSNGEYDLTIGEDEDVSSYTELGVKCVAFGKDCSADYTVKYYFRNKLTEDEVEVSAVGEMGEGIYYAVYTSPSKKYSTVKLIRNIIVLRGEDDA